MTPHLSIQDDIPMCQECGRDSSNHPRWSPAKQMNDDYNSISLAPKTSNKSKNTTLSGPQIVRRVVERRFAKERGPLDWKVRKRSVCRALGSILSRKSGNNCHSRETIAILGKQCILSRKSGNNLRARADPNHASQSIC